MPLYKVSLKLTFVIYGSKGLSKPSIDLGKLLTFDLERQRVVTL